MKEVKFKKFEDQVDANIYNNKKKFDLANKKHKRSFFNVKKKHLKIETLTSNDLFIVKDIFHYLIAGERYLFVHISDNTNAPRRFENTKFIMKIKYPYNEIVNCESGTLEIDKKEEVNVYVFNDNSTLDCFTAKNDLINLMNSKINTEKKVKDYVIPKEGGDGGVIIEGP